MGEIELSDIKDTDMDVLIRQARKAGPMDACVALRLLSEKIQHSKGFYVWTPLGEGKKGELATWNVRLPREDKEDEEWLRDEAADLVHLCSPVKFLEAVERSDRDGSSPHVGYIRDESGKMVDADSFVCTKCDRKMPKKLAKVARTMISLHEIKRKR